MTNSKQAIRTVVFSVLSNLLLAIVKFFAGVFGNSYALIADGIESTADVFSSLLVLFGMRYANRPPDENHPYGHGKAEPLMTFIDRKSTRLNSSHVAISYAVFCLKKKKKRER